MITSLVMLLVYILIIGLIVWLALYVVQTLPLPAPFGQVARVLVMVIACIVVIMLLLQIVGGLPAVNLR